MCVLAGSLFGAALGLWWAAAINEIYGEFYRFPLLRDAPSATVVVIGIAVSAAAAFGGALSAVRRVVALPPAEAMRPEPPADFRRGRLGRTRLERRLPASLQMIWRNLTRRPARAALSVLGMALAVAILIVGYYFVDAIDYLGAFQFRSVQREDMTVLFHDPRPARARHEVMALPGVLRAEPFRVVPARLRHGHSHRRIPLFGLESGSELRRILDDDGVVVPVPREGVVLTAKLAEILDVRPGDELRVEVLEQGRPVRNVRVAGHRQRVDRTQRLHGRRRAPPPDARGRLDLGGVPEGRCIGGGDAECGTEADAGRRRGDVAAGGAARLRGHVGAEPRGLHGRAGRVRGRDRGGDGVQRGADRAQRARSRAGEPARARLHAWRGVGAAARRTGASSRWPRSRSASRSATSSAPRWRAPTSGSSSGCRWW